jgi:hypothetical protein
MNEEQLKAAVLAKCEDAKNKRYKQIPMGGDLGILALQYFPDHYIGYFQIGSPHHVLCLKFNEETNSESIVWPIAADILGIKQPKPIPLPQAIANIATDALGLPRVVAVASNQPLRPSDALLWECWKESANEKEWSARVRARESDRFNEWLATLPPDTLKADRELVVDAFERKDLERDLLNEYYNYELINAIKRLAGMEVQNG